MTQGSMRAIRVLCVDDQAVVRRSLRMAFMAYGDVEMVADAASGEEALRICGDFSPDVVLMDIVMPGIGGIAATRAIRECWPGIRVLGLTSFADPALREAMLRAGAARCLDKDCSCDDLVAAVRQAYATPPPIPQTA